MQLKNDELPKEIDFLHGQLGRVDLEITNLRWRKQKIIASILKLQREMERDNDEAF